MAGGGEASIAVGCLRCTRARVAATSFSGSCMPQTPRAVQTMPQVPMAVSNKV
jgi:hypothetical protein